MRPVMAKALIINAFALSRASILWQFITQGVASLALCYALLPFQGVHYRLRLSNSSKLDYIRLAR